MKQITVCINCNNEAPKFVEINGKVYGFTVFDENTVNKQTTEYENIISMGKGTNLYTLHLYSEDNKHIPFELRKDIYHIQGKDKFENLCRHILYTLGIVDKDTYIHIDCGQLFTLKDNPLLLNAYNHEDIKNFLTKYTHDRVVRSGVTFRKIIGLCRMNGELIVLSYNPMDYKVKNVKNICMRDLATASIKNKDTDISLDVIDFNHIDDPVDMDTTASLKIRLNQLNSIESEIRNTIDNNNEYLSYYITNQIRTLYYKKYGRHAHYNDITKAVLIELYKELINLM